jgi:hypothetical protein
MHHQVTSLAEEASLASEIVWILWYLLSEVSAHLRAKWSNLFWTWGFTLEH